MMLSSVDASALLRFAENAIPTWEKRRSTEAEDAGHPKNCRAITDTFGKAEAFLRPLLGRQANHRWRPLV